MDQSVFELTGSAFPFIIACAICLVLMVFSVWHSRLAGSNVLSWIIAAVLIWTAATAAEQSTQAAYVRMLLTRFMWLAMTLLPPLWYAFIRNFSSRRVSLLPHEAFGRHGQPDE